MSGKPTVATVPPSFTVRLAAIFKLNTVKRISLLEDVCVTATERVDLLVLLQISVIFVFGAFSSADIIAVRK
jgi:hypothetical protein